MCIDSVPRRFQPSHACPNTHDSPISGKNCNFSLNGKPENLEVTLGIKTKVRTTKIDWENTPF